MRRITKCLIVPTMGIMLMLALLNLHNDSKEETGGSLSIPEKVYRW